MQINRGEIDESDGLYTRELAQALEQALLKIKAACFVIALQTQIERDLDGVLRIKSQIERLRTLQGAQHQPAAHQEHQRERTLQNDDTAFQARALGRIAHRRLVL